MKVDSQFYLNYQLGLVGVSIFLFCWGYFVSKTNFGVYAQIFYDETIQWDNGTIIDIVTSDQADCPKNYELLESLYLGTLDYCIYKNGQYQIGECPGHNTNLRQVTGFPDQMLSKIQGTHICVQRSKEINYHYIVENRFNNKTEQDKGCGRYLNECGPKNVTLGMTYCQREENCPFNGILAADKSDNVDEINYQQKIDLNENWSLYLQDNALHSPLVDIQFALSPPCYEQSQVYTYRSNQVTEMLDKGSCSGQGINGTKVHPDFIQTKLKESEKQLLQENGVLNDVILKIPNYQNRDLASNNFTLYYKPYSIWKIPCQAAFSTKEVQRTAQNMVILQDSTNQVLFYSSILVSVNIFLYIFISFINNFLRNSKLEVWIYGLHMLTIFVAFAFTISSYINLLQDLRVIGYSKLKFFEVNQCSDTVLNYAFSVLSREHENTSIIALIGFAVLIFASFSYFIIIFCACGCIKRPNAFNQQELKNTYGTFQVREIIKTDLFE